MSVYVIDASVVVKWYVEEVHSDHARRVLVSSDDLIAPSFMPNEVASAFLKKVRHGEMRGDIAVAAIPYILQRAQLESVTDIVEAAFEFALRHERGIFDSFYVLLAMRAGCSLVTADSRLYNGLGRRFAENLTWIEEYPT